MARYIDFTNHTVAVRLAAHTIGLDNKRPYYRHGKLWYRPYRNYYATHERDNKQVWDEMVQMDHVCSYIRPCRADGSISVIYSLTRKGLDWLGSVLNVNIHDEED